MSYFPKPILAADRLGPSAPEMSLLKEFAPEKVWEKAIYQAARSPFLRYRNGSVLFDPKTDRVLSSACAHPAPGVLQRVSSLHAEASAIGRAKYVDLEGSEAVVVSTSAKTGGWAWSACPCIACADQLLKTGIQAVHFAQRDDLGVWHVISRSPQELLALSQRVQGREARLQRILVPVY